MISNLPIPYCAHSLLYVYLIHGLPGFGGYDSCRVVTCGLSYFTHVFPCTKKILGEQTAKKLLEQWFEPYAAPKEVQSDEDIRIRCDTGWYKRALDTLNVQVTTCVPYTHTFNPLCKRQNRVVEQTLRVLMKQERTKDWLCLLPWAVLTMNSQWSSSTGYIPRELFHGGRPARFCKTPFLEDDKSAVGDWLECKHDLANIARSNLKYVRERELTKHNCLRCPSSVKVRACACAPLAIALMAPQLFAGPFLWALLYYKNKWIWVHARCSPRLGGELLSAPKQLKHYHSPNDLSWDEWCLTNNEVEQIDLENTATLCRQTNSKR